jgi:glycosyltransferase involved in cell wall biosynthesis
MRIGIDAREIQNGVITGIGRSLANFIEFFRKNNKNHTLTLFSEKKFQYDIDDNIRQILIDPLPAFVWDQIKLATGLKANKIDLFYSPYYKVPLFTNIAVVNQILDLMFLRFPAYRKKLGIYGKLYYAVFGKAFANKSISIITDSEHAKMDIIRLWNIDQNKIVVIPLGLGNRYKPINNLELLNKVKKKFKLPDSFILYLGNFKPHKNVTSLVEAFKRIENLYSDYKLVLAGPLDRHGKNVRDVVSAKGLDEKVQFTDTIREEDYPEALLSLADVFVFPSLYEGFGLPPLEAMACGTPVVASNLTSVPEVIGDAGILVNPKNIEELSSAISYLLDNPEKRALYSKKGLQRAQRFKEEDTAGKLYEHIISLLEEIK